MPRGVGREGKARAALPFGVERDEPLGKILRRGARLRLGARPVRAAELTELCARLAVLVLAVAADVFRHHVELCRGNVQTVVARVADLDVVLVHAVDAHALDARKAADAVMLMHDEIAGGEILVRAQRGARRAFLLRLCPRALAGKGRSELPLSQDDEL